MNTPCFIPTLQEFTLTFDHFPVALSDFLLHVHSLRFTVLQQVLGPFYYICVNVTFQIIFYFSIETLFEIHSK